MWPVSDRPEGPLKDPKWVDDQPLSTLLDIYKLTEAKQKKESGQAIARMTKDCLPQKRKIKSGEDNCYDVLHPARFERPLLSTPDKWWSQVPVNYTHVYRNIPLKHITGKTSLVAPGVISSMHDRRNCLQLKHFNRKNSNITSKPMKEIRGRDQDGVTTITDHQWDLPHSVKTCQESVNNYAAVMRQLWPYDITDLVINRVLDKFGWFSGANHEKERVRMVQEFFNTILEE